MASNKTLMLHVQDGKNTIASHAVSRTGNPVHIAAQEKVSYQLLDTLSNEGPENILLQRKGNDLYITIEGSDHANIIIDNYYDFADSNSLITGQWQDGNLYAYVAESGNENAAAPALLAETSSAQVLGSEPFSAGASWSMPSFSPVWLLALAPLAVLTKKWIDHNKSDGIAPIEESNGTRAAESQIDDERLVSIKLPSGSLKGHLSIDTNADHQPDFTHEITAPEANAESVDIVLPASVDTNKADVILTMHNTGDTISLLQDLMGLDFHTFTIDLADGNDTLHYNSGMAFDAGLRLLGGKGIDTLIVHSPTATSTDASTPEILGFEKVVLHNDAIFHLSTQSYLDDSTREGALKIHADHETNHITVDLGGKGQSDGLDGWTKMDSQIEGNIVYDVYQHATGTGADDYVWIQQGIGII